MVEKLIFTLSYKFRINVEGENNATFICSSSKVHGAHSKQILVVLFFNKKSWKLINRRFSLKINKNIIIILCFFKNI